VDYFDPNRDAAGGNLSVVLERKSCAGHLPFWGSSLFGKPLSVSCRAGG